MTTAKSKQAQKPRKQELVNIIVEHEFVGSQTIVEALTPIIIGDLQRKIEKIRTIDNLGNSS
jgi:hypothetical protein